MESKEQYAEEHINLIVDFLSNSISDSSRIELEEWLNASEANRQFFKELEEAWMLMETLKDEESFESDKAYQMFRNRVYLAGFASQTRRRKYTMRHFLAYAATIASLITLTLFAYFYTKPSLSANHFISNIEVPYGSKSQIELNDGTKVWLNAGSKLCFPNDFGKKERKVYFEGEASFEVARNEKLPFIVQTKDIGIKVLGTTFNVNTYEERKEIKIALLEGEVELSSDIGGSVRMKTNDIAFYDRASKKIAIHNDGVGDAFGWRDNQLIFDNETFEQITLILERRFDVKFSIHDNSIKKRKFKGDFVNNETLEEILKIMNTNKILTYKIKGDTVNIYN